MSRNARNAPGAWGRRAFDDEVRLNTRGRPTLSLHSLPPRETPTRGAQSRCRLVLSEVSDVSLNAPTNHPPPPPPIIQQRVPLVSDPDDQVLLGDRTRDGVPGKAGRERLRFFNRVGVAVLALGTLCSLGFAGYQHATQGLSTHDASHEARAKRTPFPLVAHEIWLGDAMPNVKRALFERNREVLSPWGWELRLWGVGDVTYENFPHTYSALKRGLEHHEQTGDNTFSMVGDLMKFEILYLYGGLYLDTNVELLKDPSPLFWDTFKTQKQAFFVSDPGDNRFVSAGMIGAIAPKSKLLGEVVTNEKYVEGVDFSLHCVANAVTGPVMLTAHLENDPDLLSTVNVFERNVAYPLACGENYLDPCVARISEDSQAVNAIEKKSTSTSPVKYASSDSAMRAAEVARSMSGVRTSSLGSLTEETNYKPSTPPSTPLAPPVGVLRRVARTAADVAASAVRWHAAETARAETTWRRRAVHADPVTQIVTEQDGSTWNTTVPCHAVAYQYPESYAIDHFSVGGASWQQNCERVAKAGMMTRWVERETHPTGKLMHDWAMSAVRYLGGPKHGKDFVKRIRLHATGGVPGKARLVVVASSLRAGGALLNEMLETTADHPVDSKIWYRENEAHADAFFVTYVTLGDLWSHGAFSDVQSDSWQDKLREYLLGSGVSEKAINEAHLDPVAFMEETLSKLWENGIDTVHVMLTQSGEGLREKHAETRVNGNSDVTQEGTGEGDASDTDAEQVSKSKNENVLEALLSAFPDSPTVCLHRRNVLDAYVSMYRAEHGDTPWQIIAEPPPAPEVGSEEDMSESKSNEIVGSTGAWGFGDDGEGDELTTQEDSDKSPSKFTDGKDGNAAFEAFGAFGDLPEGMGKGKETNLMNSKKKHSKVFFDSDVFDWLDGFENSWMDNIEAVTKRFSDDGCQELVYEDSLVDEGKQFETLQVLNDRYDLNLNLEALPLQKLRRVNGEKTSLVDFENPDDLDRRALTFLEQ